MTLQKIFIQLGINICSDLIYDNLKSFFLKNKSNVTYEQLNKRIKKFLHIKDSKQVAKIINFLASNGDIIIEGTQIVANDSISYKSSSNGKLEIKNSSSRTNNTLIEVRKDGMIELVGGSIQQKEDQIINSV